MRSGDGSSARHVRIALSGRYEFDDLDRLLDDLGPLADLHEPATVELDLTELLELSAPAAAWLTAIVRRAQLLDLVMHSTIIGGRSGAAMDSAGGDWRAVEQFSTTPDMRRIVPELTQTLAARTGADPLSASSLRICLDELAENVLLHAQSPIGGMVAVSHASGGETFEIAVADVGDGIRTTLQRNPVYATLNDDVAAVAAALEPNATGNPQRNGGFGLAVARNVARMHRASLRVRSGRASVSVDRDRQHVVQTVAELPGTIVALRIAADEQLSIKAVYDAMQDAFEAKLTQRGLGDHDGPVQEQHRTHRGGDETTTSGVASARRPAPRTASGRSGDCLAHRSRACTPDEIAEREIGVAATSAERLADGEPADQEAPLFLDLGCNTYALGRYFPRRHARHLTHGLTRLVRSSKRDVLAAELAASYFERAVASVAAIEGVPDLVVSVPPRPGQPFDRLAAARARVPAAAGARDGEDVLSMRWLAPDYKRMGRRERLTCSAGRFRARDVAGARCLLLDDVLSTGAQSGDCRQALEEAGAESVTILTLAAAPYRGRDGEYQLATPIRRPRRLLSCLPSEPGNVRAARMAPIL